MNATAETSPSTEGRESPRRIQVDVRLWRGSEKHIGRPVRPAGKLARDSKPRVVRTSHHVKASCGSKNCVHSRPDLVAGELWMDGDAEPDGRVAGRSLGLRKATEPFIP